MAKPTDAPCNKFGWWVTRRSAPSRCVLAIGGAKPTHADSRLNQGSPTGAFFYDQHKPVTRCRLILIPHSWPPILRNGGGPAPCRGSSSNQTHLRMGHPAIPPAPTGSTIGSCPGQRRTARTIRMIGSCRGVREPAPLILTTGSILMVGTCRPRPQRRARRRLRQGHHPTPPIPQSPIGPRRHRIRLQPTGR